MVKQLKAFRYALGLIISLTSIILLSCNNEVSEKKSSAELVWRANSNLIKIIDDFIQVDTNAKDHPLLVINIVNSRRCTQDYLLSSTNFIPIDLMTKSAPSKFFEYGQRLCIIVDPNDQIYSSKILKDSLGQLIKKYKISLTTITDERNRYSIAKWHIKVNEGKMSVKKEEPFEDFSCGQTFGNN